MPRPIAFATYESTAAAAHALFRTASRFRDCNSKHRTAGHTNTSISSDTRADWSEAFELAPSLQVAYVWHASVFTREVLDGLLRIGFLYPQQIIWNKVRIPAKEIAHSDLMSIKIEASSRWTVIC